MSPLFDGLLVGGALTASVLYALLRLGPKSWGRRWRLRAAAGAAGGTAGACGGGCSNCGPESPPIAAAAPVTDGEVRVPVQQIGRRR